MNLVSEITKGDINKLTRWSKRIFNFAFIQVFVQGITFLSGIILVRYLDKVDFGYYTIANLMLATMNILADSGVGIGLFSIGGKVWNDKYRFGQLINTGLHLRKVFGLIAMGVITPLFFIILYNNQAPVYYSIALTAVVVGGVYFEFKAGVLTIVYLLHTDTRRIQKTDTITALFRLAALGIAWLLLLNSLVATLIASVAFFIKAKLLSRHTSQYIDTTAPVITEDKKEILRVVKHQVGNTIFYCIQGQLTIWIVSVFGNVANVAEIGALSRLGLIFTIVSSVLGNVLIPNYARLQEKGTIKLRYFQILSLMLVFNGLLAIIAFLFPDYLLWVLGANYGQLKAEMLLLVANAAIVNIISTLWLLNSSRAWIEYYWINIPLTIGIQIMAVIWLDISTITGAIYLAIISQVPSLVMNIFLSVRGFKRLPAATYKI